MLAAALAIDLAMATRRGDRRRSARARSAPASLPEPAPARHRAAFLLRVAAFAAAAALLVAAVGPAGTSATPVPPPDFAVVPTGQRVVVIGIDGFDPELIGIPITFGIGWTSNSKVEPAVAYAPGPATRIPHAPGRRSRPACRRIAMESRPSSCDVSLDSRERWRRAHRERPLRLQPRPTS